MKSPLTSKKLLERTQICIFAYLIAILNFPLKVFIRLNVHSAFEDRINNNKKLEIANSEFHYNLLHSDDISEV